MSPLGADKKYGDFGKQVGWWRRGIIFKYYVNNYVFRGIDLKGKSVIDIGCGNGKFSIHAAMNGASEVLGLEPSAEGSQTDGGVAVMRKAIRTFGLTNVNVQEDTIQDFEPGHKKWDIVLSVNSINHLNESACISLLKDSQSWEAYRDIAKKIRSAVAEDGYLIILDVARNNFFGDLGIKNPFDPTIEWQKHHQPEVWARLFSLSGFKHPKIIWRGDSRLLYFGFWTRNRIISYYLSSSFRLVMRPN